MTIDDEILMAYADGELSAEDAMKVERAVAEDKALAERLALFADSRRALKDGAEVGQTLVPDAVVEKVRALGAAHEAGRVAAAHAPDKVVDMSARRRKITQVWRLPIAAAIALAMGAMGGWFAANVPSGSDGGLDIAALGDPAIVEALATLPSGERIELAGGSQMEAIASFEGGSGELCREFEYDQAGGDTVVAVACHDASQWDVRLAIAAAPAESNGYAPASSLETLDAYLVATGAGAPLSLEDEAVALESVD